MGSATGSVVRGPVLSRRPIASHGGPAGLPYHCVDGLLQLRQILRTQDDCRRLAVAGNQDAFMLVLHPINDLGEVVTDIPQGLSRHDHSCGASGDDRPGMSGHATLTAAKGVDVRAGDRAQPPAEAPHLREEAARGNLRCLLASGEVDQAVQRLPERPIVIERCHDRTKHVFAVARERDVHEQIPARPVRWTIGPQMRREVTAHLAVITLRDKP